MKAYKDLLQDMTISHLSDQEGLYLLLKDTSKDAQEGGVKEVKQLNTQEIMKLFIDCCNELQRLKFGAIKQVIPLPEPDHSKEVIYTYSIKEEILPPTPELTTSEE